jgi:hypothetical protein
MSFGSSRVYEPSEQIRAKFDFVVEVVLRGAFAGVSAKALTGTLVTWIRRDFRRIARWQKRMRRA